jgi:preprotein translocase subunit SecD
MKLTWRIWILLIVLTLSLISIFITPNFMKSGVLVSSVISNSSAFEQGFRQNQIITAVDDTTIKNLDDFSNALSGKFGSGENEKMIFQTSGGEIIYFSDSMPEISVSKIAKTKIKTGLDLSGGSRALVKAEDIDLTSEQVRTLIDVISNRLNVYGIVDMKIVPVRDLSGSNFMSIEIAGATPNDLEELISKQGKFEAKIGNETVFIGGERDITSVSRNPPEAIIERCDQSANGYYCNFRFSIYLSEDSAKRHAEITDKLEVNVSSSGSYLSKPLDLYLDDNLVDTLLISEGLKGRVTTQIAISGSGTGTTQLEAYEATEESMKKLQTVLITGSLPYKLEIVKLDTISPVLGKDFIRSIFIAGVAALFAVSIVVFLRYRKIKASVFLVLTSISEIVIILGIAALINWNLDLPSIAGILATIGTGIDSQIIVLDEAKTNKEISIRERMKRAMAIILGAYFTALVALIPLLWAGAGLLKGFAITTIIGITVGVLITRPAFIDIVKKIED